MEFEKTTTTTTTIRWWSESEGESNLSEEQFESQLNDSSVDHVSQVMSEGFTSGDLHAEIDGITFRGWWEIDSETV